MKTWTTEEIAQLLRIEDHEQLGAMHEAIDAGDEELELRFFDAIDIVHAEEDRREKDEVLEKLDMADFFANVASRLPPGPDRDSADRIAASATLDAFVLWGARLMRNSSSEEE